MWCTVHVLYREGKRVPSEEARANEAFGWLHMYSKVPGIGMPQSNAFFLPTRSDSLDGYLYRLNHCHLRAIADGGMRLSGVEPHLSHRIGVHQSWWIIPGQRQP